jgi:hypothetical protein
MKSNIKNIRSLMFVCLFFVCAFSQANALARVSQKPENLHQLGTMLHVGDVIFIRVTPVPFEKVAEATGSWTNHVGVVIDVSGKDPVIAESTFPLSRTTSLSRFVARSEKGRVAVGRLSQALTEDQQHKITKASRKRLGIRYDTGFNLHSSGQFCSRFVREILSEATGIQVGKIETFRELLSNNPKADLVFWSAWYFGRIPWERETITPASLMQSTQLWTVFDGHAT